MMLLNFRSITFNFSPNEVLSKKNCVDSLAEYLLNLRKTKNYKRIKDINFEVLIILSAKRQFVDESNQLFIKIVSRIGEIDESSKNRLSNVQRDPNLASEESKFFGKRLLSGKLISLENRLISSNTPCFTLYKSDNLQKTLLEYLLLEKNALFYSSPNLGNQSVN